MWWQRTVGIVLIACAALLTLGCGAVYFAAVSSPGAFVTFRGVVVIVQVSDVLHNGVLIQTTTVTLVNGGISSTFAVCGGVVSTFPLNSAVVVEFAPAVPCGQVIAITFF